MFVAERLISLVAPHHCVVCGDEGSLLCGWCAADACPAVPPRCYKCLKASADFAVCSSCRPKVRLRHVWIRTEHSGVARDLLEKYKFERGQAGGKTIARLISEVLPYFEKDTLVVPVPTATSRVRSRGYDHGRLLAKELAELQGLKFESLLMRFGQTRQVGAKRQERIQQLDGAFGIKKPLAKETRILLVDDVATTGATLEEAAKVLKRGGAKQVDAVVFAQKRIQTTRPISQRTNITSE